MTDLFQTTPRERLGLNPSRSTGIQKKEEELVNVVMTIVTKGELWREKVSMGDDGLRSGRSIR